NRGARGTRPGAFAPGPAGGVRGRPALSSLPLGDTTSGRYSTGLQIADCRLQIERPVFQSAICNLQSAIDLPKNPGAAPPMLTPAEELGLSGHSLAGRVRKAFYRIPEARLVELLRQLRAESFRRHLIYLRDGQPDAVRVLPCPVTVLPEQLAYIHYVSLTIL